MPFSKIHASLNLAEATGTTISGFARAMGHRERSQDDVLEGLARVATNQVEDRGHELRPSSTISQCSSPLRPCLLSILKN